MAARRAAPPGRKGSVRREAFKTDEDVDITPISVPDERELEAQARAEAARLEIERQQEAARQEAARQETARLEAARQEAARQETARKEAERLEAARQEAAREEAARREAARLEAERQEAARQEAARQEAVRLEAERQEAARREAARLEEERQEAARQEAERREAASREAARLEAERQEAARQEAARLEAERREAASREAARLEAERQEAARQEAARQETARREAARLEAERQEAARQEAARQEAIRLEAERQEAASREAARLEAERQEAARQEAARLEAERLEAEAKLAEEERQRQLAEQEAHRLALAKLRAEEEAQLEEKRKQAEEAKRKRAEFLASMDNFSSDFSQQKEVEQKQLKESQKRSEELALTAQQIDSVPKAIVVAKAAVLEEEQETKETALEIPPIVVPVVSERRENKEPKSPVRSWQVPKGKETIATLSSSLFAAEAVKKSEEADESTNDNVVPANDALSSPIPLLPETVNDAASTDVATKVEPVEELRVPTRIGKTKSTNAVKLSSTVTEEDPLTAPIVLPPPGEKRVSEEKGAVASEDEDEEGAGTADSISNFLTKEERRRLTIAEKATWRAKQMDLTTRRKGFHGAVTYMFDGIFSWQMYGSAEAMDEYGNTYTEYLMRCQWGTTFENLQPWIVAHRYREFDKLDNDLKKRFPELEKNMPKLPKKEMFRNLDANVVAKRRTVLEEYMVKIVESMPTILRSDILDTFLRIKERIASIKDLLNLKEAEQMMDMQATEGRNDENDVKQEDELKAADGVPVAEIIWSADEAEEMKTKYDVRPLDEYELGTLEEMIRNLLIIMRKSAPSALLEPNNEARNLLRTVTHRWPALRATAVVNMGVDFTLIPRAMQAEEELIAAINEWKSFETIRSIL